MAVVNFPTEHVMIKRQQQYVAKAEEAYRSNDLRAYVAYYSRAEELELQIARMKALKARESFLSLYRT